MTGTGGTAEFEALARRMWNVWSEALAPTPATPAEEGMRAWRDGMAWWSRLAQGQGGPTVDASLGRFSGQAQQWFAQMQQLASGFSGQQPSAAQVVDAWKRMLGGATANPLSDLLSAMQGQGLQDPSRWMASLKPLFDLQAMQAAFDPGALSGMFTGLRAEGGDALSMPTFGPAREHQARWQALAKAQADHRAAVGHYQQLLQQSTQAAFGHFERLLAGRGEGGKPIGTARALFDLWIDAAEDAYAELALSREFRSAYADLVNSQMRVRAGIQREVEEACASLGMPTRRELDGAHRKAADLERTVRGLRDAVAALQAGVGSGSPRAEAAGPAVSRKPTGARAKARREAAVEARLQAARAASADLSGGKPKSAAQAVAPKQVTPPDADEQGATSKVAGKRRKASKLSNGPAGRQAASSAAPEASEKRPKSPKKRKKQKNQKKEKRAKAAAAAPQIRPATTAATRRARAPLGRAPVAKRAAALVAKPARRSAPALNPFAAFASIPDAPAPLAGKPARTPGKGVR